MTDELHCFDLFAQVNDLVYPLFENALYPWEILPRIGGFLEKLIKAGFGALGGVMSDHWK